MVDSLEPWLLYNTHREYGEHIEATPQKEEQCQYEFRDDLRFHSQVIYK